MRGMRGVGGGSRGPKKLPTAGRNVEGVNYRVVDVGGERQVRCKACGAVRPVKTYWLHGTSEDPHEEVR
jgi:hypothetical protein